MSVKIKRVYGNLPSKPDKNTLYFVQRSVNPLVVDIYDVDYNGVAAQYTYQYDRDDIIYGKYIDEHTFQVDGVDYKLAKNKIYIDVTVSPTVSYIYLQGTLQIYSSGGNSQSDTELTDFITEYLITYKDGDNNYIIIFNSENENNGCTDLSDAIAHVNDHYWSKGKVITFYDLSVNRWVAYQYTGINLEETNWTNIDNWTKLPSKADLDEVQQAVNTETNARQTADNIIATQITAINSAITTLNSWKAGLTDADSDTIINTLTELLAAFQNIPEGVDIATLLNAKVNVTDIVNNLTSIFTDKPLSAYQGKILKDLIDNLQTQVNGISPTVNHDSTLSGNGTTQSPLSVVKPDKYLYVTKTNINGYCDVNRISYPINIKILSVTCMSNCDNISFTINSTNYDRIND